MENYTRLNKNEIETILALFSMHKFSSCKLLDGGSENTNYLIELAGESYVLCVLEQKTEKKAVELAHLLKHLDKNDFKTSKIIDSVDGHSVINWKEKPVLLKTFISGGTRKNLTPLLLKNIGKELAKLHLIEAPDYLPTHLNYGKEQFQNVSAYAPNSDFEKWLNHVLDYISPFLKLDLPKALIHSDLFWDNVLISKNEMSTTIIDFEESVYYYRIFDIGMAIIGTCGENETINLDKAKHFLEGYLTIIQLSTEEIGALKSFTIYAGASMTFWRHQNYNFVRPDLKMANHYKGLKKLVDFMINQADDCFINMFGK